MHSQDEICEAMVGLGCRECRSTGGFVRSFVGLSEDLLSMLCNDNVVVSCVSPATNWVCSVTTDGIVRISVPSSGPDFSKAEVCSNRAVGEVIAEYQRRLQVAVGRALDNATGCEIF